MQSKLSYLFVLLVCCASLFAENKETVESSPRSGLKKFKEYIAQMDTTYMKPIDSKFVVLLSNPNWMDYYTYKSTDGVKINFRSDLSYNVGVGLGYKRTLIYVTFNASNMWSHSSVKNTEFDFNVVNNVFSFEFYTFSNNGKTNITSITKNGTVSNVVQPFDGLKFNSLQMDLNYYFNHKRYSNVAAYSTGHNAMQLRNAGSLIAGLSFMHQKVNLDLRTVQSDDFIFADTPMLKTAYNNYLINIGYGYNYLITPHLMANLTVLSGVGMRFNILHPTNDKGGPDWTMSYKAKIALTYTHPVFFCGLNCQNYSARNFDTANSLDNSLGLFVVFVGKRF